MDSGSEPRNENERRSGRRPRWSTVLSLGGTAAFILWLAHACALLPTSRLAARSFVLNRDYRDMRRIFLQRVLPPSFHIERIYHAGAWFPAPDGPPKILYEASVDPSDYPNLVSRIGGGAERMMNGFDYRRGLALSHFQRDLPYQITNYAFDERPTWSPLVMESHTTRTADGRQYGRRSYVAVDDRSSETIRLYITTFVPYEDEVGYPRL